MTLAFKWHDYVVAWKQDVSGMNLSISNLSSIALLRTENHIVSDLNSYSEPPRKGILQKRVDIESPTGPGTFRDEGTFELVLAYKHMTIASRIVVEAG
jgi:hypothetical protein